MREGLTAELEAALVRELEHTFEYENIVRFKAKLVPPVFALVDSANLFGRWVSVGRRIEISRSLLLKRPWIDVIAVLQHEMAHQFVDEVLHASHEPAHGDTFQRVCAERGIDAKAGGILETGGVDQEGDRVLERIRKLLALAGSDNQNEAELAMRKAHQLMLKHNVEAAAGERRYCVRQIGDLEKRSNRLESAILGILAEFFFVKVIIVPIFLPRLGRRGKAYEISGTRANVDMAEHVYSFLLATALRLWEQNRADRRVRNGRDKLAYTSGVILGFREKLVTERRELKGEGLIWVGDADLDAHYHARHRRITTRRTTTRNNAAHAAGREAGRTVVLHKPMTSSGTSGGQRLLR